MKFYHCVSRPDASCATWTRERAQTSGECAESGARRAGILDGCYDERARPCAPATGAQRFAMPLGFECLHFHFTFLFLAGRALNVAIRQQAFRQASLA